jgi:hypothetical protein
MPFHEPRFARLPVAPIRVIRGDPRPVILMGRLFYENSAFERNAAVSGCAK